MPRLRSPQLPTQSFKVLIYLEWILLGIAAIAALSPLSLGLRRPRSLPPGFIRLDGLGLLKFPLTISLGAVACIVVLWWLGRRPPRAASAGAMAQILVGFGLSWLAILLGGRGTTLFPPLLLIVVIRGCPLFRWPGRLAIATGAFCSFLLMQLLALKRAAPFGIPLTRLPRLPRSQRLPEEWLGADGFDREAMFAGWQLNAAVNASILFALVLAFVLMMMGALLNEKESRDRLAIANQKLRRYALLAEDQATLQERSRIAREMHDSVGHSLTAQSIQLENVAALLRRDLDQAEARLTQARALGREALKNVRQTVASLRSDPLGAQPLVLALRKLADEFQQNTRIAIALEGNLLSNPQGHFSGNPPENIPGHLPPHHPAEPSPEIKTALYRIVQEGLTNITKHSQATAVTLNLQQTPQGTQMLLSDNGVGFDPAQNTTGFGLQSMAERVRAIGGQFQLNSQSGSGTQLIIQIDYESP